MSSSGFEVPLDSFSLLRRANVRGAEEKLGEALHMPLLKCITLYDDWFELPAREADQVFIHELLHLYDIDILDYAYDHEPEFKNLSLRDHLHNADSLTWAISSRRRRLRLRRRLRGETKNFQI